jgi:hypothetical protein
MTFFARFSMSSKKGVHGAGCRTIDTACEKGYDAGKKLLNKTSGGSGSSTVDIYNTPPLMPMVYLP